MTKQVEMWFDAARASQTLSQLRGEGKVELAALDALDDFIKQGYCVMRGAAAPREVVAAAADLDAVWSPTYGYPALRVDEVRLPSGVKGATQDELMQLGSTDRDAAWRGHWRIHGFEQYSLAALGLLRWCLELPIVALLLGEAERMSTIAFGRGSEQRAHQDWAVSHVVPRGALIGVWIALEDVGEDAGPLAVYPGTHRLGPFGGFAPYPEVSLRTCSSDVAVAYYAWIDVQIAGRKAKAIECSAGDVVIWHAALIHEGRPRVRADVTRRSFVCHLVRRGSNAVDSITATLNW